MDLRIFEVSGEEKKEITFDHHANFFLYTTLEHARPMNQGRVPVSAATLPVLTGTPVAGMAYLDRPKPAGYFIFPDLSVRHEGKYRLSFNLYEEVKNPQRDADPEDPTSPNGTENTNRGNGSGPRNSVQFRLEVKSNPFNVFSAKKFPGLSESTSLSRLVNEQGCRVRIRRDVRMRRRDKVSDSYIGDDICPPPPERFSTQPQPADRPRSTSNASTEVSMPYSADRRQSYHDINYYQAAAYPQAHAPPPQSASSYTSHLSFGSSSTPHYQTPTMVTPSQSSISQTYQQSPTTYPYGSQQHTRQLSGPQSYGYSGQPAQQSAYGPPTYVDERSYPDSRRSSGAYSIGRSQGIIEPYDRSRPATQQASTSAQLRSLTPLNTSTTNPGPPSLPPIKALVRQSPLESGLSEPKSSPSSIVPHGPHNPFSTPSYGPGNYHSHNPPIPQSANPTSASQPKRLYGDVFDATPMNQPMHGGMRPNTASQSQDLPHIETADGEYADAYGDLDDMAPLVYKRADGSRQARKCPSPRDR